GNGGEETWSHRLVRRRRDAHRPEEGPIRSVIDHLSGVITPQMLEFMRDLREVVKDPALYFVVTVGVVGGSDLVKITEQLGKPVMNDYDYVFSENGLLAHKNGELIGRQSLKSFLGDNSLKVRYSILHVIHEAF
ncbi:hypothetical protein BHE74_00042887, partial [Ensete ventricosum]